MTSNVPDDPATPAPVPRAAARRPGLLGILVFDVAGPYLAYSQLHAHGISEAKALVLSGIIPAVWVIAGIIRQRHVDILGVLVLFGIIVGAVLGLLTGSARLVLLEGSVPTALVALAFLGSLLTSRPLLYRFALEFAGPGTPEAARLTAGWAGAGFRRALRRLTAVWGAGYLAEALARVIIVENTSTSTALAISKVMPLAVTGVLLVGTLLYRRRALARRARWAAAQPQPQPQPETPAAPAT
jgi:uncharacterized membrane protein